MAHLFESLPLDQFVWTAPSKTAQQGPYGCFAARTPEQTCECHERLKKEKVYASLREGNIRVSTHLYNTEQDIDKLIRVIAE
jgi:selenocysteine lyase/cysteine desulfurase